MSYSDIIEYLIGVGIIISSIYILYYLFSRGIIKKISEAIIEEQIKEKELESKN